VLIGYLRNNFLASTTRRFTPYPYNAWWGIIGKYISGQKFELCFDIFLVM